MRNNALVRRRTELMEAEVADDLVALDVNEGTCYSFNSTASRVWALVESPITVAQLTDALVQEFAVERDRCERELTDLLADLERRKLVEITPA